MADINVERKGPSIWPWVIGLLVLALLIWAIAEMVDTDEDQVAETEQVEEVEEPPAAVPTPTPTQPGMEDAVEFETLTPIGSDDIGRQVQLSGEVVGQPTDEGFWVRTETDQQDVIFVQGPARTQDGQELSTDQVEQGQNVQLHGTLEEMQSEQADQWMQQAQLEQEQDFQDWNVLRDVMLSGEMPQQQDQMAPGQQQMQGQDTVQGRY